MSEAETEEAPKYDVKPGAADPYATWLKRELKHDRGLLASRYDASGRYVFAGAFDNFVHRWDLSDESEEGKRDTFAGHESWVRAMAWFPPGQNLLVTGDYVGRLIVWPALDEKAGAEIFHSGARGLDSGGVCEPGRENDRQRRK